MAAEVGGWAAAASKDAAPAAAMPVANALAKSSDGVQTVVVDANALIRGISMSGLKFSLCTVKEVVNEVRDPQSRAQLQALPVELTIIEPSPESLAKVVEFARATGDKHSLSAIDLKVLALAHTLEVQVRGGDSHLRARPPPLVQMTKKNRLPDPPGWGSNVDNIEEWDEIDKKTDQEEHREESRILGLKDLRLGDEQGPRPTLPSPANQEENDIEECKDGSSSDGEGDEAGTELSQEEARLLKIQQEEEDEEDEEDDEESVPVEVEDGSDGEDLDVESAESEQSWTLLQSKKKNGGRRGRARRGFSDGSSDFGELSMSSVACMTTDFAMQNVILQMGLRLLTPNGIQVRELQRWVLRCHACNTVTREMDRLFCPKCGNGGTLSRVSVSVGANGTVIGASRRRVNIRGTRYSLPLPKGGREGAVRDPVLREDQLPHRILHPKKKSSSKASDDSLDFITSFEDILRPQAKQSYQTAASMRNIASQLYGRRNPNDSHYAKQRKR